MFNRNRITELDLLKGLIMIFMALDHFIYFLLRFHAGEFWNTPYPDFPAEFLRAARLISHICAPGFVFLAGTGLQLAFYNRTAHGMDESAVKKKLLLRGALIILLQLVLEPLAWLLGEIGGRGVPLNSNIIPGTGMPFIYLGVLYTIGASMVMGIFFLKRNMHILIIAAITAIIASTVLIRLYPDPGERIPWIAGILFSPGIAPPFMINYPLLPWLGLFLLGMAFGRRMRQSTRTPPLLMEPTAVVLLSVLLLLAGTGLRFFYPWGESHRFTGSLISFFELSKYPPSPAFLILAMGSLGLFLSLLLLLRLRSDPNVPALLRPLDIIGKEPLFFYFLHLFFYGTLSLLFIVPRRPVPALLGWMLSLAPLVAGVRLYQVLKLRHRSTHR